MAAEFASIHGCPTRGVAGVIDGSLIRISTPPRIVKLVYNTRKCFYGVTLLAMCDAQKRFIWCRSGVPGSVADSRALKDSEWYRRQTTPGRRMLHPGFYLLGDGGVALDCCLLKPFPRAQLNGRTKLYNRMLPSTRVVVEQAFGLLKGRWLILHREVCAETELVPAIVDACVRLHNYLIDVNDVWTSAAGSVHADSVGSGVVDLVGGSYEKARAMRKDVVDDLWRAYAQLPGGAGCGDVEGV